MTPATTTSDLAMNGNRDGDDGNVIRVDFGHSQRDRPADIPERRIDRRGSDPRVTHVGFESTKCPPGTVAVHVELGACEILWSNGFMRMIKYWVGDPDEGIERRTQVHVHELMAFRR